MPPPAPASCPGPEFAAGTRGGPGDISRIGYYVAFGYFSSQVVLEGITPATCQRTDESRRLRQDGLAVPALVTRAHEVLDADATS